MTRFKYSLCVALPALLYCWPVGKAAKEVERVARKIRLNCAGKMQRVADGIPPKPQADTTPQIDNDGWIEWKGGECPVDGFYRVDLKLRGGVVTRDYLAELGSWSHQNHHTDIIAYRVIENDGREGWV